MGPAPQTFDYLSCLLSWPLCKVHVQSDRLTLHPRAQRTRVSTQTFENMFRKDMVEEGPPEAESTQDK